MLLQSALDSLPSHIAILDHSADIIGVNYAWKQFGIANGFQDSNVGMGQNYLTICAQSNGHDSEQAKSVAQGIENIINERDKLFRIEYPCHSPKARRWFILQVARFEWENQLRVITSHQNVTDLKKAQQAYAQSERRLQTIVDTVVDGIFTADEHGNIESINPAVCEIFGYQEIELIGKNINTFMPEPYASQYMNYIQRHRQFNHRRYEEVGHEVQGIRRGGIVFPMYLAMSRAYLGNRWIFTGVLQDLTPRKRIEQEMVEKEALRIELEKERELSELKNRFMSMISHELRTPLSVIMLSSDFMRRYADRMSEEEKLEAIATIQTQVQHLETMVDDVSALSRASHFVDELRNEPLNLIDLCGDIIANVRMLSSDSHHIQFNVSGNCPDIFADSKLLRQAIMNLLNNAVKYSAAGSTVSCTIDCDGEAISVTIADEGIGIPETDQAKLFEPFHRASNVDARPGTGLGLAVTKRAIELHGGTVTFHSIQREGTTFVIEIPTEMPS